MISVIIPVHMKNDLLPELRKRICSCHNAELIFVVQNGLLIEGLKYPNEHHIFSGKAGRGNNFAPGLKQAKGEIVLFNHCDTLLPVNWYEAIDHTMKNANVAGGAFSLQFDKNNFLLKILTGLSTCLFHVTGEIWGDRSIFTRTSLVSSNSPIIDVPIMEDVRLSHFLRKKGKIKLLPERVITKADTFSRRGILKHVFRIIHCRLLYLLRKDLNRIYDCYYS